MLTRSDLSLIAVRVVALTLIAYGITNLPVLPLVWTTDSYQEMGNRWWYSAAVVSTIVWGVILFVLSRPFARLVMPRGEQAEEPPVNLSGIQSVAFSTIGLFLIVLNLPDVLAGIAMLKLTGDDETRGLLWSYQNVHIIADAIKVVLGVVLCTGPSYWTRQFKKFRDLGYTKSPD